MDLDVKLVALGDICPGDHYFTMGHGTGHRARQSGLYQMLQPIATAFQNADTLLINLEGPLSETSNRADHPVEKDIFRGPESVAKDLQKLGVNIAHIANNHVLQHGARAFENTLEALRDAAIEPLGLLGGNDDFYSTPVFQTVKNTRLGFLGYSAITERYLPENGYYAVTDLTAMQADIDKCRESADSVIVSLHFGEEGVGIPSPEARKLIQQIAGFGPDLIIGHHTHVFQPVTAVDGVLTAYSLGDALFDLFWDKALVQSAACHFTRSTDGKWRHAITPFQFRRNYRTEFLTGPQLQAFNTELEASLELMTTRNRDEYSDIYNARLKRQNGRNGLRKLLFFLQNLYRGDTSRKLRFISQKFTNLLTS